MMELQNKISLEKEGWDADKDYPEPGAKVQVICVQIGQLG
jgi:hypothetical protein